MQKNETDGRALNSPLPAHQRTFLLICLAIPCENVHCISTTEFCKILLVYFLDLENAL